MYLLNERPACPTLAILTLARSNFFQVHTRKNISSVVKASCLGFIQPEEALLLFILPDTGGSILGTGDKSRVERVQVQVRDLISVAHK